MIIYKKRQLALAGIHCVYAPVLAHRSDKLLIATTQSGCNFSSCLESTTQQVQKNKRLLVQALGMPIQWMAQVHGSDVHVCTQVSDNALQGDALFTECHQFALAVLSADCLPLVLYDKAGKQKAVVHVGWRGLADGIIEKSLAHFCDKQQLCAWLGPAIGARSYTVKADMRTQFLQAQKDCADCFYQQTVDSWFFDIAQATKKILMQCAVPQISGGDFVLLRIRDFILTEDKKS